LPTTTTTTGQLHDGRKLLGLLLLSAACGCSHARDSLPDTLSHRLLPPPTSDRREAHAAPTPVIQPVSATSQAGLGQPIFFNEGDPEPARLPVSYPGREVPCGPAQTLTLHDAIETAFRLQPRLRVYLEGVEQARRAQDVAFAPFLPMAAASYSVGGFDLNAGGLNVLVGTPAAFTFIPALGAVPIGLDIKTGYELADLKLQWLICDFGRRLGGTARPSWPLTLPNCKPTAPTRR